MNNLRRQIPSSLSVFNIFNRTYYHYFYGHFTKHAKHIHNEHVERIVEDFIENHFNKLNYSLIRFEEFLLWLFSKYGKLPLATISGKIEEYLKEEINSNEIKSFAIKILKYMRDNKIQTLHDYILPIDGFYPKIIQHYIKDKDIPFEVLLYLKIFDRISKEQKKTVKSLFRKEMYNINERMIVMEKNKGFITEELKKVMDELVG